MAEKNDTKELTCTICLEAFTEPKVLPCCHTFCKKCLEATLEKSDKKEKLTCPQCRAEHEVGTDDCCMLVANELIAACIQQTLIRAT